MTTIVISRTLADNVTVFQHVDSTVENDFLSGIDICEFNGNTPGIRRAAAHVAIQFAQNHNSTVEVRPGVASNGSSSTGFQKSQMEHVRKAARELGMEEA